jgi:sulfopyruvate decarboxylase subunit alpha
MSSNAARFFDAIDALDYGFFTGVPCSLAKGLFAILETERADLYVPAVREDIAVGLAAGSWLAGRKAAVIMQNSGLGVCANALASLHAIYRIPTLLVVTWRGFEGKDAPEHIVMGEITEPTLRLLAIPSIALRADAIEAQVREADALAAAGPAVLLVRNAIFS